MADHLYGIVAEFAESEALKRAVSAATQAGYSRLDAFSPFPMRDVASQLGARTTAIPWIAVLAGLTGAIVQYGSQYWMNVIDYPINVGGRPLHSWPAFIPATIIVAILWAGLATLLGLLLILRLPQLHHPLFGVPNFDRVSNDAFFLCILSDDPRFDRQAARDFLETLSPRAVREAPACD
jgi:ActD protein